MESKICTYSEPKVRLQFVRIFIESTSRWFYEIRFNRKVVARFTDDQALLARYRFSDFCNQIIVNRDATFLLNMTV